MERTKRIRHAVISVAMPLVLMAGISALTASTASAETSTVQATVYPQGPVTVSPGYTAQVRGVLPSGTNPTQVCATLTVTGGSVSAQFYGDPTTTVLGPGTTTVCSSNPAALSYANSGMVVLLVTGMSGTPTFTVTSISVSS